MLMKFAVQVSFLITYCVVRSKILEFQIYCFASRLWKIVFTLTNFDLVSHSADFGTWFHIILVFRLHWYLICIIQTMFPRIFFLGKLCNFEFLFVSIFDLENLCANNYFYLVLHCANFCTWFNILLLFGSPIIFTSFLRTVFRKLLEFWTNFFVFRFWKPVWTYLFNLYFFF